MSLKWQLLKFPPAEDVKQARECCHQAIQNVAAIGRSFLPSLADDSQSSLEWDFQLQRLAGKWIDAEKQLIRSSIDLNTFSVYLVNRELEVLSSISMAGIKQKDVMIWLENEMRELGLDFSKLDLNHPYIIPEYETSKGKPFIIGNKAALNELSSLYHNAAVLIIDILSSFEKTTPVRCWPHHFDIAGNIIQLDTGDPSTTKSIGLGMSPGDKYYDEPYFYVNSWPYVVTDLPDISHTLGFWHEEDWVGAVLLASTLKKYALIQDQRGHTRRFYDEIVGLFREFVK